MIPAEAHAEFVAAMDEALAAYERPYGPIHPMVCMDNRPVRLVKETSAPLGVTEYLLCVAHHCTRAGTPAVFMFCETLEGSRDATTRQNRTKAGRAHEVAARLDGRYTAC